MELENLQSRVTHGVDDLRERTADLLGADGRSVFRELSRLGRRIDEARTATDRRIDAAESSLTDRVEALAAVDRRTSWPRRIFWMLFGTAIGMAAGYLADPDRGRGRRAQMTDQFGARSRDLADDMRKKTKLASDRTRGQVIEKVKGVMPQKPTEDPIVLEQRIKSTVFGGRDDTSNVVIRVDGPGTVALKGTVPTMTSERELLSKVSEVDGVIDVRSELQVNSN